MLVRSLLILMLLAVVFTAGSLAAGASTIPPAYVPNQLIVQMASGSTDADIKAAMTALGASVNRPIALPNTYLVDLNPTRGEGVEAAATRARSIKGVVRVSPNYQRFRHAIPNDPLWSRLWGMRMINAPAAWDTQKGSSSVVVAVLDDGISLTHPEFQGRLVQGRDTGNGDDDPSHSAVDPNAGHGTHVAGIIAAQGNNSVGVVGVCWNGVKIMPVKIFNDNGYASTASIIDGLDWAMNHGAQVVNMSYGGYVYDQFEHDKIKELYAAGIILVASAGNSAGPVEYPAAYDEVVAVSAVDAQERPASYTNYGLQIDIAAPGGDDVDDGAGSIWSTAWVAGTNTYHGYCGTSMAAPHVSGAAALLLSAGVSPSKVVSRLYRGARAPSSGTLNRMYYGNGILDVNAALHAVAEINIIQPSDAAILDTTTPEIRVQTSLVQKESIKMYLDYPDVNNDGFPDDLSQNIVFDGSMFGTDPERIIWDDTTGLFIIKWPISGQAPLLPGVHKLCVTGEPTSEADPIMAKDYTIFFIQPRVIPAGKWLISIPYALDPGALPDEVFGTSNYKLARWVPENSAYALWNYPGYANDPNAWPSAPGVRPEGGSYDTPPAGLGFWYDSPLQTPVIVQGQPDTTRSYTIRLTRGTTGWNMIGDPFPFNVSWNLVKVEYRGTRLPMSDAVTAGWIRPWIYGYTASGYQVETMPSATLRPWEGYWVRILPNYSDRVNDTMTLIIPPLESGGNRSVASTSVAAVDGWTFEITATTGSYVGRAVLGVSSRSIDGWDFSDIDNPPPASGYVDVSFVHNDWGGNSGRYVTDYRSSTTTTKVWTFDVSTDMPNRNITLSWKGSSALDRYTITIQDMTTGATFSPRTRSSYVFNSGARAGSRRFKLTVVPPGEGGRLR